MKHNSLHDNMASKNMKHDNKVLDTRNSKQKTRNVQHVLRNHETRQIIANNLQSSKHEVTQTTQRGFFTIIQNMLMSTSEPLISFPIVNDLLTCTLQKTERKPSNPIPIIASIKLKIVISTKIEKPPKSVQACLHGPFRLIMVQDEVVALQVLRNSSNFTKCHLNLTCTSPFIISLLFSLLLLSLLL